MWDDALALGSGPGYENNQAKEATQWRWNGSPLVLGEFFIVSKFVVDTSSPS